MSIASGPNIISNGLVLTLDVANPKSYSTNVFTYPLDAFAWAGPGGGYQMTLSRDSSVTDSPVGGIPLKIVTSGSSAYTGTYNAPMWNLAPAAIGQTWTFSFYVKGTTAHTASLMIFEANSAGNYTTLGQYFYNVTTSWTRVSGSYTMSQATTSFVQVRIDDYNTGVTIWVDGFQLERTNAITTFNSKVNLNGVNWYDSSGTNNNGTLVNGPAYNSLNLGSIVFDGVDDSVNAGNGSTLNMGTGDFSIESYFKAAGSSNYRIILQKGNPGVGSNRGYRLRIEADNTIQMTVTGDAEYVASTSTITYNTWYQVLGTKDSSGLKIYLNGALSGTGTSPTGTTTTSDNFTIGRQDQGNWPFNGNVSLVNIYNRSLTAAEVAQNFNAFRGRYGI